MTNRAFSEAREHWKALIAYYPQDLNVLRMFGIGKSYFQERQYQEAFSVYDQLRKTFRKRLMAVRVEL